MNKSDLVDAVAGSADMSKAEAGRAVDAVLDGKFKIEISKKYSLDEVKQAHEDLEGRLLTGPAVIKP